MAVRLDAIEQTINLTAVDGASGVITQLESRLQQLAVTHESVTGQMTGQLDQLKKYWEIAWELADQGAKFEQAEQSFNSMVRSMGLSAEGEFTRIREMSGGLIDDKTLLESANRAMSLGIPIQQLSTLMEVSRAKARDMGLTASQAFNDIITGVGEASPEAFKHMGLVIDEEKAYRAYAQSVNKTVSELSAMDKKQALVNASIGAGGDALNRQNLSQLTAQERMQQLTAIFNNLKTTIGSFVIDAGFILYGLFQGTAAAALALFAGLMKIGQGYEWLQSKISFGDISKQHAAAAEEMRINAEAAWNAAKDLTSQAATNLSEPFIRAREEAAKVLPATPVPPAPKEQPDKETTCQTSEEAFNIVSRYEQEAAAAEQYAPIIAAQEDLIATAAAARGHVAGAVNQSMENQLMRLVEMHKFSAGAIAKALGQAVKVELVAVAAKAAVHALYFTALGLAASTPWGAAALGPPGMFFAAAAEMASISAASLAAAVAVNALVGPSSPHSATGTAGGSAEATTAGLSATLPEKPVAEASQPSQVVNVHVYGNIVDHDAFARELVPAIQKATSDGVR